MTTSGYSHVPLKRLLVYVSLLLVLVTACARQIADEPTPPVIHYGEDVCELCGMIVSEAAYAAAYVTADGHAHVFDDIGDMIRSHLKMNEAVTAFFVHDYNDERWIRAETAYFILSDPASTPMGSGLAACEQQDQAEALASRLDGQFMTFEEVLDHYQDQVIRPGQQSGTDTVQAQDHH
jgi:nitrous oxide reductase accessory protein NosL